MVELAVTLGMAVGVGVGVGALLLLALRALRAPLDLRADVAREVKRDLLESSTKRKYTRKFKNSAHISPSRRTIRFEKSLP